MTVRPRRLGLIVPSSNTSVEIELPKFLPPGISLHAGRLPQKDRVAAPSVREMAAEIEHQAALVASAAVDLILVAATVPTLVHGLDWDRLVIDNIKRQTGINATTATTEMISALKAVGAKRVVLGTPFIAEMNELIVRFLTASGFEVAGSHGMGIADNIAIGHLPPSSVHDVARKIDQADADTILLVCTNWSVLSEIAELEDEHGKPVIAVTQACLRGVLSEFGYPLPGAGPGRLFSKRALG